MFQVITNFFFEIFLEVGVGISKFLAIQILDKPFEASVYVPYTNEIKMGIEKKSAKSLPNMIHVSITRERFLGSFNALDLIYCSIDVFFEVGK